MAKPNPPTPDTADAAAIHLPEAPCGFRWTRQRREVYEVLMQQRDHPTAAELYFRAKSHIPGISLATVYNCLETLTQASLVKQVNFERTSSRYCPNLTEHAHFYDETTGEIRDVEIREGVDLHSIFKLPRGVRITRADISLKGVLPQPKAKSTTNQALHQATPTT